MLLPAGYLTAGTGWFSWVPFCTIFLVKYYCVSLIYIYSSIDNNNFSVFHLILFLLILLQTPTKFWSEEGDNSLLLVVTVLLVEGFVTLRPERPPQMTYDESGSPHPEMLPL